jgi:two-component system KDP operon response regulator KdpE
MLDPVRRRVERSGTEIHLTPREFDALSFLMTRAGRPVTHARLLTALRGPGFGEERSYLRVLIGQLRKKLEDDASNPIYLLIDSSSDTDFVLHKLAHPHLKQIERHSIIFAPSISLSLH